MKNTEKAFRWIVEILIKNNVPFQITGGLAAKFYGSGRPLNDIDIDIPDNDFSKIIDSVDKHIIYGPAHYIDERWDCILMTLDFEGQKIDISGGKSLKVCDAKTGVWNDCPTNFQKSVKVKIFEIEVPVINRKDLIKYKSMLAGDHQQEDIKAILGSNQ